MLVHHPDPLLDRVAGRVHHDRLAADPDLPLVRRVEPVEDVHQRRLAGAVLAEQRVHLAAPQVEVDRVVRDDAGEALGDAAHLEDGGLVPPRAILTVTGRGRTTRARVRDSP